MSLSWVEALALYSTKSVERTANKSNYEYANAQVNL